MTRICIGEIATAHGVKGLIKVRVFAEDETLLNGTVYTSEDGSDTICIQLKNSMNTHWLAQVEGISDRTAAEALRGTKLYIDKEALPEPDEDEFYYDDLIGLAVISPEGEPIGKVIAVENFGASDLLDIKPAKGGASFYLPFTDETVPEIRDDIIIAVIPEGLLE